MTASISKNGFALVQVLMLSVILSVILISFSQQAKSAIDIAESVLEKGVARIELETAQSRIELQLITRTSQAVFDYGFFNVYSNPFGSQNIEIKVQDMSSLFTIHPHSNTEFENFLQALGSSIPESQKLSAALNDWQDTDNEVNLYGAEQSAYPNSILVRNAPLSVLEEIKFVKGFDNHSYLNQVLELATLYPNSHFNPMNAPEKILGLYVKDPSRIKSILNLRADGKLSSELFAKLSGLEPTDRIMFSPGQAYRLQMTYEKNGVKAERFLEMIVKPYAKDPITNWQIRNTQ